jgi:hypothetical protein
MVLMVILRFSFVGSFGSFGAAQDGHVRSYKRKYCERGGRPKFA